MSQPLRCEFRDSIRCDGECETARCGVLQEIVGIEDASRCRVGRDACEVCRQSVVPAIDRINQVIASFLFTITGEIVEQGGAPGCDVEKASQLHHWAEHHLEVRVADQPETAFANRFFEQCCYLGTPVGQRVEPTPQGHARSVAFRCLHPAHRETTEQDCRSCRDWSRKADQPPSRLEELLGAPKAVGAGEVRNWAVGVTTAPRRRPTLETCLDFLARAGWNEPRLFVDYGVSALSEQYAHLPVTLREPAVGAWPNYYLALMELLCLAPDAEALMIVQDDACYYDRQCLREYLERALWPTDPPGIVSLYCSSAYTNKNPGWHAIEEEWVWGALAFIFPRARALEFVTDPQVIRHRMKTGGLKLIDEAIGQWARRCGVPIHYTTPSLVQHLGTTSTLWPGIPSAGFRRADWFAANPDRE